MSSSQLTAIEHEIEIKVAGLADAISICDSSIIKSSCDEIQQLIAERNRKCKIMK